MKALAVLIFMSSMLAANGQSRTLKIAADSIPILSKAEDSFKPKNSNPFAVVAGGSKGIGFAIAEALALRRYNLILIARHWDGLQVAQQKLESTYGIHVEILQHDLSQKETAQKVANVCI